MRAETIAAVGSAFLTGVASVLWVHVARGLPSDNPVWLFLFVVVAMITIVLWTISAITYD